jgi:acyl-coenzyme A thioesterase PaaI-like protein
MTENFRRDSICRMEEKSLQETYAPHHICFGCGVANEKGLRIRSFAQGETVVCEWMPHEEYQAFPGMVNGGIIGTLFDCHSNWTAAWHLMNRNGMDKPPCTVTAEYSVRLSKPTPATVPLKIIARVTESSERKAVVEAKLIANDEICATSKGVFIAVKEGHPAYHRW